MSDWACCSLGRGAVWGAGWFTAALVVGSALRLIGVVSGGRWFDVVGLGIRVGVIGAFAGAAFAGAISVLYRGRHLSEISAVRFGIGGGIVSALFIPPFLQLLNVLSGTGPIPWGLLLDDLPWVTVFGAVAAGGSLKLAQLAALAPGERRDSLEHQTEGRALGAPHESAAHRPDPRGSHPMSERGPLPRQR